MSLVFILLIILFFYFDLALLRRSQPALFHEIFRLPRWLWGLQGLAAVLVFLSDAPEKYASVYLLLTALPVYVLKRRRFKTRLGGECAATLGEAELLALDAFNVALLWFTGMILLKVSLELLKRFLPLMMPELGELVLMTLLSFLLILVLICRAVKKYPRLSLMDILGLRQGNRSWMAMVLLPGLVGLSFAGLSSAILYTRTYSPVTPLSEMMHATTSSVVFLAFLSMAVVLAPFFEEIIFRGFFFYVISRTRGMAFAVIFIGLVFGGLHIDQYWGDWAVILMVTLLGLALTAFRAWTGSCWPGIIMHYVYNGAMTVIPIAALLISQPVYLEYSLRYQQLTPQAREELLLKSIQVSPDFVPPYNDLAWLYSKQNKDLLQALEWIEWALQKDPDNYAYLDTKAEVLFRMGRSEEAVEIESRLVQKYPQDAMLKRQLEKFQEVWSGNKDKEENEGAELRIQ